MTERFKGRRRRENTMKGLQGKDAVVTGGSSGIGQAIAIRLGEEGVDVAINYGGRPEGAEETKESIEHGVNTCMKEMSEAGTHPTLVDADVSQEDQVASMFERVLAKYGRIDYLINNAGIQVAEDTDKLA
ncbi:MAG: SDR family NAD(P)-dependent oxidoreductase, partial [Actinomycetes bacterium]